MLYIRVLENREMAGKEFGGEYFGGACATRSTSCVWLGYTERACVCTIKIRGKSFGVSWV